MQILSRSILAAALLTAFGAASALAAPTNPAAPGVQIANGIHGVFVAPPTDTPSGGLPGGPLMGNGDLGIAIGGPPEALKFYVGKADFFGVLRGGESPVGSLTLNSDALRGAKYRMSENIGPATVTGAFAVPGGAACRLNTWVSSAQNLAVIQLHNTGSVALPMTTQLQDGYKTAGNAATYGASANSTWLNVSPDTVQVDLGNRLHGGSRGPFTGSIADVEIFNRALPPAQLTDDSIVGVSPTALMKWTALKDAQTIGDATLYSQSQHGGGALFTGDPKSAVEIGALRMPQSHFTITAWVNASAAGGSQSFILAAMEDPISPRGLPMHHGLALELRNGSLSARLNMTVVTAPNPLPLKQWVKVSMSYDGTSLTLTQDGQQVATTNNFPTAADVMGYDQSTIHFGDPALPGDGDGPKALLIQRVIGATATEEQNQLSFQIPAGHTVTILLAAVSNRNAVNYAAAAQALVDKPQVAKLWNQHVAWWKDFWSKSYVTLSDAAVQNSWYGSLYIYACCSRPGSPPPGLWGNFITRRNIGWQGDYTLDYNAEAPSWAAYATNHFALADNYEDPLLAYMPRGAAIAAHNGQQGLSFYTHLIPGAGWDDDPSKFMSQRSAILFGCVDCAMRWKYTDNVAYAKKVYPLMRGTAEYWDHYLVLKNGLYTDTNDATDEFNRGATNTATTLAFLRLLYPALIQMSDALHVDAPMRPIWRNIDTHLSPIPIVPAATIDQVGGYPGNQTLSDILGAANVAGLTAIRDSEIGTGFPNPMMLQTNTQEHGTSSGMNSTQAIFPGWQFGLNSSRADQQAALGTVALAAEWYDYNDDCSFYSAAADAGYNPATILQHLGALIQTETTPNFAFQTGGGGIEDVAIVPAALSSMFLQSYQGDIHLFPDWPATENASFGNIPACGGFLVTSSITGGHVPEVEIKSLTGGACTMVNPWPGDHAALVQAGKRNLLGGNMLRFPTKTGQTYQLFPKSPDS